MGFTKRKDFSFTINNYTLSIIILVIGFSIFYVLNTFANLNITES